MSSRRGFAAGVLPIVPVPLHPADLRGLIRLARDASIAVSEGRRDDPPRRPHGRRHGDLGNRWLGDGLIHLASALGDHDDPELRLDLPDEHRWVAWGSTHLDLLDSPAVYEQIRRRLAGASPLAADPAWPDAA